MALTGADVPPRRLDEPHPLVRRLKPAQGGCGSVKAIPRSQGPDRRPPRALVRWAQVVAAFDTGGRPAVIRRLTRDAGPTGDGAHPRRGTAPVIAPDRPVFRTVAGAGNLSTAAMTGSRCAR